VSGRLLLVTGGAGFIGSHVVDAAVAAGWRVRVLDALHPLAHAGEPNYLNPGAEYVWGDVRDRDLVADVVAGADAVSHQAAMVGLGVGATDVEDYASHNDFGTGVLLSALARRKFHGRLVLASSMVVYGEGAYRCPAHGQVAPGTRPVDRLAAGEFEPPCPACGATLVPEPVSEATPGDPRNVYAATKLHQEHLCAAFGRETGAAVISLRYHNVYGPRMPRDTPYAGVASIFRSSLQAGEPPRVFEDGGQLRDFIHVGDVARANLLALAADPDAGGPVNVATGRPRTIGELAGELARAMDGPEPLVTGEFRLGDVRHVFASAERAHDILGFEAQVPLTWGCGSLPRRSCEPPPR
jgi:dTDP-L-rhamnose 4-epimerase